MPQSKRRIKRKPKAKLDESVKQKDFNTDKFKDESNDASWYAADPALMRDAASIPFSWATGTPFDLGNVPTFENETSGQSNNDHTSPGIQVQYLLPSVGNALYPTDPINIASNSLYAFVRHANSGHANYDAPDLMLYVTAMSNVYSYINFLQRAYGFATLYAQGNRYLPKALLRSNFINAEDVQANLADFRYGINVLINKAASFAIPSDMTLFRRHAFLYQYLYTEGTSIKDQLYMYAPAGFWQFQLDDEQAGMLKVIPFACTSTNSEEFLDFTTDSSVPLYHTVQSLINYGNQLLDPLIASEDMNIMSGDILKAYTLNGILKLQTLPTEYPLLPVFNIEVLEQMKNATILPAIRSNSNGISFVMPDVKQSANKGYLISYPSYSISNYIAAGTETAATVVTAGLTRLLEILTENRLITTTTADVSPELIMVNTRLMIAGITGIDITNNSADIALYPGSEIPYACCLWYYDYDDESAAVLPALKRANIAYVDVFSPSGTSTNVINANPNVSPNAFAFLRYRMQRHCMIEHFDFHPMIRELVAVNSGATTQPLTVYDLGIAIDIDNYGIATAQDIRRLHETALLSMLKVASIGRVS